MNVELSERAQREMQRIDAEWRSRAELPELFLDELLDAVTRIETTGVLGTVYPAKSDRRVTRLLMEKSRYHLYLVRPSEELVVIVSIWSAQRRRGPNL